MNTPASTASAITDEQIDAYLAAQRKRVQEADDAFGRDGLKCPAHLHPVREACRAGLEAALAATGTPQGDADGIDLLDDLCFAIEARAAGQAGSHRIAECKAELIRLLSIAADARGALLLAEKWEAECAGVSTEWHGGLAAATKELRAVLALAAPTAQPVGQTVEVIDEDRLTALAVAVRDAPSLGDAWHVLREFNQRASTPPAPAAPSPERVSQKCMPEGLRFQMPALQLTGHQLLEALEFLAPDRDEDQMESTLCVALRDGGIDVDGQAYEAGLCCWLEEYPEEGSLSLEPIDAALAASTKGDAT